MIVFNQKLKKDVLTLVIAGKHTIYVQSAATLDSDTQCMHLEKL